ncbi:DGQHR domain-containing protein DpdB [Methylophaga pinxianii]|uniref:DGQHR domain-containing protein DpdB n=1 Tax=Methylophaga pinxianii TaxID=2881052 RepID=UPI001CF3F180|nr:DGQHR domain-containing protein DpdB [Methylophaga pinxianii]MCB2427116.1 DGQHR domain-containing protein [Methylophaga pinxianii]UPH44981.1 DGQHR domain-containing protein [Methylophaga pinxianii]
MEYLKLPALAIQQGKTRKLFSLAVPGKQISKIASITRIKRQSSELTGYQRPEVSNHIKEIQRYIESTDPLIPNPVIIAFDKRVSFEPSGGDGSFGFLLIPISEDDEFEKPGFIVDGQQRTAALREACVENFMMPVSAFIAESDAEQREQFMLVNSTKPLPKTLLYELAPHTDSRLPSDLQQKKFPSKILQILNFEEGPLKGRIKTATNQVGKGQAEVMKGAIADNSILKLIDGSLRDGALNRFRDPNTGEGDVEQIVQTLNNFWTAVSEVFPNDWKLPPKKSRLLHGAGITALGSLMDEIDGRFQSLIGKEVRSLNEVTPSSFFKGELESVKPYCCWSKGTWVFGKDSLGEDITRRWDEVQNLSRDINILSDYLLRIYRKKPYSQDLLAI